MLFLSVAGFLGWFVHKRQNGGLFDGPLAIGVAFFAVRVLMSGVRIGSDVVTIRGAFRTYVLSVDEVTRFEPAPRRGNHPPQPVAHRTDGRAIAVSSLSVGRSPTNYAANVAALTPLCEQLNDVLRAAQAAPVSTMFGEGGGPKLSKDVDRRDLAALIIGGGMYGVIAWAVAVIAVAEHPSALMIVLAALFAGFSTASSWVLIRSRKRSMQRTQQDTSTRRAY
jgi:hypothetical protein